MKKKITTQLLCSYREHLTGEERSRATIEKYTRDLKKFYQFLPDSKRVNKNLVIAFKNQLLENYKPSSVNSMLAAVNGFLAFIGRKEFRVRQIKIQRQLFCRAGRELTKADYRQLTEAAKKKNRRLYLIIQTIGATGIRISELPYITAETAKQGWSEVDCKGKNRRIFLPTRLRALLKQYAKEQGIKTGPLFLTRNRTVVNRSNIWKEMKELNRESGVSAEKIFPHNLRHLFARTYYAKEKDIVRLADILGHSSVETTRIYTISSGREHMRHLERLDLVISG